jgi:ribosomal protein S18 acetylase RimI-like enzyme
MNEHASPSQQEGIHSVVRIVPADSPERIAQAHELFCEYAAGLGFDLAFQNFQEELENLPGEYAPPSGRLLLAFLEPLPVGQEAVAAGCGALRKISAEICEMKRLYVRPDFRGKKIGRLLAEALIAEARAIGYPAMRLDTVPSIMAQAIALYRSIGFREIPPYRFNPLPSALFLELVLR